MNDLTLRRVIEVNAERCKRWHHADTEPWTGADWSNAMCGEAGEAANVVKKLRRGETNTAQPSDPPRHVLQDALAYEIADTILYALLLAEHYDIDVEFGLIEKFNIVSERNGFPERLP